MASAGLVLLIACLNLATLLLGRAASRQPEMATRLALGATRARIARQLLIESVVVALGAAVLGLLAASSGLAALSALLPPQLAGVAPPAIDTRVLTFTVAVATSTGIVFGLWPAVRASQSSHRLAVPGERLVVRGKRLTQSLVVAEVAFASLLVVGAGLMVGSLRALLNTELGMHIDRVATARLTLPSRTYADVASRRDFIRAVLDRLREAPGVAAAAAINTLPLAQESGIALRVVAEGAAPPEVASFDNAAPFLMVSPGYFETMGIRLIQGRDLSWNDGPALPVAVVNRRMAHRLWPGEDAIGRRFVFGVGAPVTVVGVVEDVRAASLGTEPGLQAYLPIQERPQHYLSLVARSAGEVDAVLPHIGAAVRRVDPALPVYAVQPMESVAGATVAPQRLTTILFAAFGLLALCLAAIGVYGVLAYAVTQRRREIGLRIALGAQPARVLSLVVRQGLAMAAIGVGLGVAMAVAATRLLEGMLYGIAPRDPSVFAAVALLFGVVALCASLIPASRAAGVDPMSVMRAE